MKNAEFSKLLKRGGGGGGGGDGGKGGGEGDDDGFRPVSAIGTDEIVRREIEREDGERKRQKAEKRKKEFVKAKSERDRNGGAGIERSKGGAVADEDVDGDKGDTYRDRAAERRRENGLSTGGTDFSAFSLREEESKIFGGDMEHAHLVKGLDYALLKKVRDEIAGKATTSTAENHEYKTVDARSERKRQEQTVKARTNFAKRILLASEEWGHAQNNKAQHTSRSRVDRFLPGRSGYIFDVRTNTWELSFQVPTEVQKSKADCPAVPRRMMVSIDPDAEKELHKVMAYVRAGTGRKLSKKKQRVPSPERRGVRMVGKLIPSSPRVATDEPAKGEVVRSQGSGNGHAATADAKAKGATLTQSPGEAPRREETKTGDTKEEPARPGASLFNLDEDWKPGKIAVDSGAATTKTGKPSEALLSNSGNYFGAIVRPGPGNSESKSKDVLIGELMEDEKPPSKPSSKVAPKQAEAPDEVDKELIAPAPAGALPVEASGEAEYDEPLNLEMSSTLRRIEKEPVKKLQSNIASSGELKHRKKASGGNVLLRQTGDVLKRQVSSETPSSGVRNHEKRRKLD